MSAAYSEFVDAGRTAFARSSGNDALGQLGFAEVLADLSDHTSLLMAMATFQAQGAELADSSALARVLGQPFAAHVGQPVVCAACPLADDGGALIVGPSTDGLIAIDGLDGTVRLFAAANVRNLVMSVPGRLTVSRVELAGASPETVIGAAEAAPLRICSIRLGRVAAALEILGAARAAVSLAVEYAKQREQFDRPIAKFQAVQHLLAWATTDCEAIEAAASLALLSGAVDVGGTDLAGAAKAIAGRNGLSACERSMQVLGGIGFTAEHDHHHFHSRVLILDSLLGSRVELARSIGRAWRTDGNDRGIPAAVLAGAAEGL